MMTLPTFSFTAIAAAAFVLAGCQHQDAAAPAVAPGTMPPPTVTSSPVPPPEAPAPPGPPGPPAPPGPMAGGPHNFGPHGPPPPHWQWHGNGNADEGDHVYKLDFVLTPKDPKDATLTPTSFTIMVAGHETGEVMVGKNVPLGGSAPVLGDKSAQPHFATPRQDVGLKVKVHPQPIAGSDDIRLDVEFEMSSVEGGGSIRKVTTHENAIATPGKSAQIVSVDDDKRHYELTVTTTKVR